MNLKMRAGLLGSAAALGLSGVAVAGGSSDDDQDALLKRLAEAEARIAELEAKDGDNWMTEARAEDIRSLVHDVLADADTRASLLQTAGTSGYDNGVYIRSADGNWLLRTNFLMQQRFVYADTDSEFSGGEDSRYGFENPRTVFNLSGHVVSPEWYYDVRINVGTNDGAPGTRTGTQWAYLGYDYGNGWSISMGHMRLPFTREELVNAEYQLAVERSTVGYMFTAADSTAIAGHYTGDQFRFSGAFSNGVQFGSGLALGPDTEYALTGRFEYLFNGNWDQFDDFTNPNGGESGFMLGGAVHFEEGEDGTAFDDLEILAATVDASLEFDGANAFGALYYADFDAPGFDFSPLGFVVQGGIHLSDAWELFARYEFADFDISGIEDVNIATVGVNRYFAGHNAKWTTDFGYSFDEFINSNFFGDPVAGLTYFTEDDDDGQFVIRSQLQIMF